METKGKVPSERSFISTVLYISAIIVALIAIALLVINIRQYTTMVNQYVAQGYPAAEVVKQFLPNQLLPGIFQAVGLYGGMALVLFGVGAANKKTANCLSLLTDTQLSNGITDESSIEQNSTTGDAETSEQLENIEETTKG
jgi:hypothetical protein